MRIVTTPLLLAAVVLVGCSDGKGGGIEPEPARVARVEVDPATTTVDVGALVTLTAAVYDQAGNRMSRTDIAWHSEAPAVAAVQPDGRVQALAGGSARIVATVGGVQGSATLTVRLAVAEVRIARRYPSLFAGDTTLLPAVLTRTDGTPATGVAPAWTSSNPAVAVVSDAGVVTGASPGVATVRAAAGTVQDEVTVVVLPRRSAVNREIAFRSGNEIRMALPGQAGSTLLSDPQREAVHFAWAPDGDAFLIAYFGAPSAPPGTEIGRVSGGAPARVSGFAFNPHWAPDGSGFVYTQYTGSTTDLFRQGTDGTASVRLTTLAGQEDFAQWSPDGRRIAFVHTTAGGPAELWVMNADGSGARKLQTGTTVSMDPRWSPDGKYLAFHSCDQVWVIDSEGLAPARSIGAPGPDLAFCTMYNPNVTKGLPQWSPDGGKLVYVRLASDSFLGEREVETVSMAGAPLGSFRVSNPGNQSVWPAWSPDGTLIAFSARRTDDALGIGVARPDGSGFQWVTEPAAATGQVPFWRP